MLSLQSQEHEKALLPVLKKRWMLFLGEGTSYSGSGGDGESDVLRARPGCPLSPPPVSQRCPWGLAGSRPGGQQAQWAMDQVGLLLRELHLCCPLALPGDIGGSVPMWYCQRWPAWASADVVTASPFSLQGPTFRSGPHFPA